MSDLIHLNILPLLNSAKVPLCNLCVLGASVVESWAAFLTTEAPRSQRSHRVALRPDRKLNLAC
jgi:hypothetical protein